MIFTLKYNNNKIKNYLYCIDLIKAWFDLTHSQLKMEMSTHSIWFNNFNSYVDNKKNMKWKIIDINTKRHKFSLLTHFDMNDDYYMYMI